MNLVTMKRLVSMQHDNKTKLCAVAITTHHHVADFAILRQLLDDDMFVLLSARMSYNGL